MNLEDILGKSSKCSDAGLASVGSFACPFKFGLPDGIILLKKGYKIPAATEINKAFFLGLIQTGVAIPLLNSFSFEPINEDDVLETSVTGVNDLARKGLTSLNFTYKKGIEYEKAIEKLTSFGAFDVLIVDKIGNILGVEKQGDLAGWTAGLLLAKSKMWNTGSESEGKAIEVQLTQPGERKSTSWIEAGSLDFFAPTELDGINGTVISYADTNGAVPPASTDATIKVQVLANDKSTPVIGLATNNFTVDVDGVGNVVTGAVDDGEGFYTLTLTTPLSAGIVVTSLYDVSLTASVAEVSGILFTGSVTATAV